MTDQSIPGIPDDLEFFDMDGKPMTVMEWAVLFEDIAARTIGYDRVTKASGGKAVVSTTWNGERGEGGHDIFSTGVNHTPGDSKGWVTVMYHPTKELAAERHAAIVAELRDGPDGGNSGTGTDEQAGAVAGEPSPG